MDKALKDQFSLILTDPNSFVMPKNISNGTVDKELLKCGSPSNFTPYENLKNLYEVYSEIDDEHENQEGGGENASKCVSKKLQQKKRYSDTTKFERKPAQLNKSSSERSSLESHNSSLISEDEQKIKLFVYQKKKSIPGRRLVIRENAAQLSESEEPQVDQINSEDEFDKESEIEQLMNQRKKRKIDKMNIEGSSRNKDQELQAEQQNFKNIKHNILREKVSKLLKRGFTKGVSLSSREINMTLSALKKNVNIFVNHREYEEFLKMYGSIYGHGFQLYGPHSDDYRNFKYDYLMRVQRGFMSVCEDRQIDYEKFEFLWLVARHDEKDFFIDSSPSGKDFIYSMSRCCGIQRFAKNFIIFLEKIDEICEYENS